MTTDVSPEVAPAYRTRSAWNPDRPHILVIACSDGRLQHDLDEFLSHHLGITRYDRVYLPGGPGALTSHGVEFLRSDQFRRECIFLVEAHDIQRVILVFHGPSSDGPDEATCADYRRLFPRLTSGEIRDKQQNDVPEILNYGFGARTRQLEISVYRCEATADGAIEFAVMRNS